MKNKIIKILKQFIIISVISIYFSFICLKTCSNFFLPNFYIESTEIFEFDFSLFIKYLKIIFPITTIISNYILVFSFYISNIQNVKSKKNSNLNKKINLFNTNSNLNQTNNLLREGNIQLYIGNKIDTNQQIYISDKALYQNLLITGAIGSGKTSGAIYPILNQLLSYNISGLILDVKGNMAKTITNILEKYNKKNKLIIIELNGKYKYNPLHKPKLKAYVLANRLITILALFSNKQNNDTYWFDKAENLLTQVIKLIRLYNNGYVTFIETHKIVNDKTYLESKLEFVKNMFLQNKLNNTDLFDFNTILSYFKNEYVNLDNRVSSIITSEITRLTSIFLSDIDIQNTFCPNINEINFDVFNDILINKEIVLLQMNIAQHQNLSKIISAYLKLDFQTEVLKQTTYNISPSFFVCDEYQEYVTENDTNFFSLAREYKCINIISTQSYSSILNTLNNQNTTNVLLQSFINKIFLRTDDIYTIEQAQKLFGKQDKIKYTNSISENAQETNYNHLLNIMQSKKSNISESISTYITKEDVFDSKDFSQNLKIFEAIIYISNGTNMLPPSIINLNPYFERRNKIEKK